ncbi:hypothetical protein [Paraburkholderia kururiensis]|uniref:hypothetical protein n=1 Tax=Paraburkholderia kururiensis TaxID=984307 RepID=UPI000F860E96|nr:hypothetical protein [Paraburkholderia kururiensis]
MKKVSLAILVSLSALTGAAYAQSDTGITMSTDPAKAADIEQRAQALQSAQPAEAAPAKPMRRHGPVRHHKKAGKAAAASGASM